MLDGMMIAVEELLVTHLEVRSYLLNFCHAHFEDIVGGFVVKRVNNQEGATCCDRKTPHGRKLHGAGGVEKVHLQSG